MSDAPPPLPEPDPPSLPFEKAPTTTKAPPKGKLFPCVNCGAKVEFDPATRSLTCPYCGHAQTLAEPGEDAAVVERDFEEYLENLEENGVTGEGLQSQVRCSGCGAVVMVDEKVVTDQCPFCGTHIENQPETVSGMMPPESLLPFKLDLRDARTAFDRWLHKLWFAPNSLKKLANLGQLNGVYVPYWTYDSLTFTRYHGQRGVNYTVVEEYTERDANGNNVTKTRTVTLIRWDYVSGSVEHFFDDVLVCGSRTIREKLVIGMEPWNTHELEPFMNEFLSGFKTERYVVGLREGFSVAKKRMEPIIDTLIRQDIGGDHQRIDSKSTQYMGVTFKHCLLPVWVAHYRYYEKLFHILINGRTGKVSGERPYSWVKIASLVAIVLLIIGLVIFAVKGKKRHAESVPSRVATVVAYDPPRMDDSTDCLLPLKRRSTNEPSRCSRRL